jgi:hypothetical protein
MITLAEDRDIERLENLIKEVKAELIVYINKQIQGLRDELFEEIETKKGDNDAAARFAFRRPGLRRKCGLLPGSAFHQNHLLRSHQRAGSKQHSLRRAGPHQFGR